MTRLHLTLLAMVMALVASSAGNKLGVAIDGRGLYSPAWYGSTRVPGLRVPGPAMGSGMVQIGMIWTTGSAMGTSTRTTTTMATT